MDFLFLWTFYHFDFLHIDHEFLGELLIGPNDVGGQCPSSTYQYNAPGICSDGCCCCGAGCCWDKCDYTPGDCIEDVANSEWRYVEELGYYRAFRKLGIFCILASQQCLLIYQIKT